MKALKCKTLGVIKNVYILVHVCDIKHYTGSILLLQWKRQKEKFHLTSIIASVDAI